MNTQTKSRGDAAWNLVGLISCFLVLLIYSAFVAAKVWSWTMPVLFGLPSFEFRQMVALLIVVAALRGFPSKVEPDSTPYRTTAIKLLAWTVLLGLGAVASSSL
ncbi:hypothetical protein [Achromobacter aegrifaciens]|uniref:hypothetical protein n=1 Tax=Achromobacter aegrifaciens TaxID=1287736 RepID=UPI000F74A687|nr:hypothetical protein [Achromobacter aegrifaciens]RSF08834.1 hypothetical protein EGU54_02300 [Achromobacter aegrifaciens]